MEIVQNYYSKLKEMIRIEGKTILKIKNNTN